MAKIDLTVPSLENKFIDLRDTLPGDAYNFSWERPLTQVNYLAIHHTGGENTQTPQDLANEHITKNGWAGIGYHFLIDKEGVTFYVGDISTARANVANLNEQVIGIGLIGNFVAGQAPTKEQLDSTHKLCEFLLSLTDLVNIKSWDKVRGHKELPDQSTPCPGDAWDTWRIQIVEGVVPESIGFVFTPPAPDLASQVDSLQFSLASLNQQVISLQQNLQERDQEIVELRRRLKEAQPSQVLPKIDDTLTIVQALINLYKFALPPRKDS